MQINFDYHGSIKHLNASERAALRKELFDCIEVEHYDCFICDDENLGLCGSYDDDDGYVDYARDIETVLLKYDVEWEGGYEPEDSEPDYDRMPGGVDFY